MYNSDWYNSLIKPFLSPPDGVFLPVWTVLYITILISFILYFTNPNKNKKSGYIFFFVQFVLNLSWSFVFFKFKSISGGLIIIFLMGVFIFLTIKKFYSVSKVSGLILIPYFLWVLFAAYLNLGFLILNWITFMLSLA